MLSRVLINFTIFTSVALCASDELPLSSQKAINELAKQSNIKFQDAKDILQKLLGTEGLSAIESPRLSSGVLKDFTKKAKDCYTTTCTQSKKENRKLIASPKSRSKSRK